MHDTTKYHPEVIINKINEYDKTDMVKVYMFVKLFITRRIIN